MPRIILTSLLLVVSLQSFGHEGHDHGPKAVQAPKGGVMRELETVNLELLTKGNSISIYIYDKNLKPVDVSKYPVSGTVALPKKAPVPVALVQKGDHWETQFESKGAHRIAFVLSISQGGHNDNVKFTVEPKK